MSLVVVGLLCISKQSKDMQTFTLSNAQAMAVCFPENAEPGTSRLICKTLLSMDSSKSFLLLLLLLQKSKGYLVKELQRFAGGVLQESFKFYNKIIFKLICCEMTQLTYLSNTTHE